MSRRTPCSSPWLQIRRPGFVILQTPNAAALHKRLALLRGRNPVEAPRTSLENPGHLHEYTLSELRDQVNAGGLTIDWLRVENYFGTGAGRICTGPWVAGPRHVASRSDCLRSRWPLALVLILCLGAALVLALTRSTSGPGRAPAFGADLGAVFQTHDPPAVINRALTSAQDAGLGLGRVAALWELTEPAPPRAGRHHYDWRYDDDIAQQLTDHGFRWLAILAFAPGWASVAPGVLHAAPRGTADYAAYAAAVARRYRGLNRRLRDLERGEHSRFLAPLARPRGLCPAIRRSPEGDPPRRSRGTCADRRSG